MPSRSPGRSRSTAGDAAAADRGRLRPAPARPRAATPPGAPVFPACAGRGRLRVAGSLAASQGEDAGNRRSGQQEQSNDHGAKDSASRVAQDRWTERARTRENRLRSRRPARCLLNSRAIRSTFATRRPTAPRSSSCQSAGCSPSTAWAIRERQALCSRATRCEPPARHSACACSGSTAGRWQRGSSNAHGGRTPSRRARTSPHLLPTARRGTGNRCSRSRPSPATRTHRRRSRSPVRSLGASSPPVRVIQFAEGRSAQILHVGGPATEHRSVVALFDAVTSAGLRPHGHLHEIRLSDYERVPGHRARSILRLPIEA